ncbi:hypothetical protein GOP47_0015945 [Adiantum capillus-veneris]|uniref:Uncharacterized protein n=1 Tax=Adiantum capillus-veneris TaxID=13818 RepID=A0A9D4UL81_ADICA|nr:hypothetical protein GOP47_0015945 [Adiantum capillus-veneris]
MMIFAVALVGLLLLAGMRVEGRTCGVQDLELRNEYVATSECEIEMVNNCPCEVSKVVVSCADRRWTQRVVNHIAMEVDVPSFGRCTLWPKYSIPSNGLGRTTYSCAGPVPLSLLSADFAPACSA